MKFTGKGALEGQGYWWWVHEFLGKNKHGRPHLVHVVDCENFEWEGVEMRNSPQYHMKLDDIVNVEVHHMEIFSDWWGTRSDGKYNWRLPIFPLNTDGIDPSGKNVYIHDVVIQNYDDAVAVKPAHQKEEYVECAEDMLIERATVYWGVGMTIGSVPPNNEVNCVRNITFRDVDFHYPFKAIYVKTNPGNSGTGIIEDILYENINIHWPIWWGTYIGPQQQHQPDGSGPGCMFYPLIKECETNPRVPMRDITLRNVHTDYAVLSPGIIRCNETNPCTGFDFDNVTVTGWLSGEGYITENVEGVSKNSNPIPAFIQSKPEEEIY